MQVGEKEVTIEPLDANRTVKLVQFFGEVWGQVDAAAQAELSEGAVEGRWMVLIKVLKPVHLIKLTSILVGLPQSEVGKVWSLSLFSEVLAELSEVENLKALVGNLQRVAAAYQG